MEQLGKLIVLVGVVLVVVGLLLTFFDRIPLVGKLPGDIHVKRDNFHFYFPLGTSILLSLVLSAILWLIGSFGRR